MKHNILILTIASLVGGIFCSFIQVDLNRTSASENKASTASINFDLQDNDLNSQASDSTLKIRIYFKSFENYDEEGNEIPSEIYERENFQVDKGYTYCYEAEDFYELILEGSGEKLSLTVMEAEPHGDGPVGEQKVIFQKNEITLDGKIVFTISDFSFNETMQYVIQISDGSSILFSGGIKSEGCM